MDRGALAELGVDDALIRKRERLDGERALAFLAELPELAASWQDRLELCDARVMPGGVLSAALACRRRRDDAPVVLKLSSSEAGNARAEAAALQIWGGVGAPALLYEADEGRVMLLEAIKPGTAVDPRDDRADAGRAAGLLRTLHRNGGPPVIPDATDELRWRFQRAHEKLDGPSFARDLLTHRDIDEAHRVAVALHADRPRTVLCHGDFINKNLLLDEQGDWWAIDPRPCLGDPCLDAAFWALAHRPGAAVEQRCRMIAEAAELSAERVWRWAQVFAISESVLVTDGERARAHHRVAAA